MNGVEDSKQPQRPKSESDSSDNESIMDPLNNAIDEDDGPDDTTSQDGTSEPTRNQSPLTIPAARIPVKPLFEAWKRLGLTEEEVEARWNPHTFTEGQEEECKFWASTPALICDTMKDERFTFKVTDKAAEHGGYHVRILMDTNSTKQRDFDAWLKSSGLDQHIDAWVEYRKQQKELQTENARAKKQEERETKDREKAEINLMDAREKQSKREDLKNLLKKSGISLENLKEMAEEAETNAPPKQSKFFTTVKIFPRSKEDRTLQIPEKGAILEVLLTHPLLKNILNEDSLLEKEIFIQGTYCPRFELDQEIKPEEAERLPKELLIKGTTYPIELIGSGLKVLEFSAKTSVEEAELNILMSKILVATETEGKIKIVDQRRMTTSDTNRPTTSDTTQRTTAWQTWNGKPKQTESGPGKTRSHNTKPKDTALS
eukprot:TRINITY_DN209_c0_g2_i1.p1 TRINITY_DN209_c0_g2~~TRINITY_DN209_c0_g2_i1.p1  ORF type:complete len:430 (-),score=77.90 TRINITY_DN209_c0_g2_i1:174-1463(-)